MELLNWDAIECAQQIAAGKLTALEAVEAYIAHLQHINPLINCLVEDRFELARMEAAEADLAVKEGRLSGRLLGVPISVKDCFHVKGMKTTSGLLHRKDGVEEKDAVVIERLRQEGAIIIGKTNTPQFCFCQETDNKLIGRTNNPWNLDRTPGGSSGGEGALIAAGGAALGIGADIGGSIRFPSHFNGIVGFKSGNKQVPDDGNYPAITVPEQERMLGIGAMAKSVRDARLMNEIIADVHPEERSLSSFSIDVLSHANLNVPLGHDTVQVLEQLSCRLKDEYETGNALPPLFDEAALIWQQVMSIDGGRGLRLLMAEQGKERSIVLEYVKERLFRKSDIHSFLSWALIGTGLFKPSPSRLHDIRELFKRGDEILNQYFNHRIVIMPVYHRTAPEHGKLYQEIFSIRKTYLKYMPYVSYANTWGLPSLTVPSGEDASGLPIGLQLISRVGNEEALFQLGEWIEENFRTYKRCTLHDK